MDTRKLEILKNDTVKMLSLSDPGKGGDVIARIDPGTCHDEQLREVVRRFNAFPAFVELIGTIARNTTTDEADGQDLGNDEAMDGLIVRARALLATLKA